MAKIDTDLLSQSCQLSVSRIKGPVFFQIIFRIEPFFLELSPYCFRNIQMRRVWRQESDEQSTLLPERYPFHDIVGFMHAGIIRYQYGFLSNAEGKLLRIFNDRTGSNSRFCHHSHVLALSVDSTTVSDTDVLAVLNDLTKILKRHLDNSEIVRFGDFGTFQVALTSDGTETAEKFHASLIKNPKVAFRRALT
jgi:hypothetical protein